MSSFLAVCIAFLGACIAWAQWYTARQKLVLDLFDKRYERIAHLTLLQAKAVHPENTAELLEFDYEIARLHQLFGDEVVDHGEALLREVRMYRQTRAAGRRPDLSDDELVSLKSRETEIMTRFIAVRDLFDDSLSAYLRMNQKLPRPPHEWPGMWWAGIIRAFQNRPTGTEP